MYFIKPNLSSILSFQQTISIDIRSEMVSILLHTPCLQSLLQFLHVQCLVFLENTSHVFSFCKICSWKTRWIFSSCSQHTYKFSSDRIKYLFFQFSSVQLLSRVRLFATPWIAACQASLSITNSWSLPKLLSIESVMPSSHLILGRPLLLLPPSPPSIRVFSNESILRIRWPKYWSFSFNISPSNEHPGWSPLGWTGWISLKSKGLSRVFSNTTVQKHQFFCAQLSSQSNSHIHTWPQEKP